MKGRISPYVYPGIKKEDIPFNFTKSRRNKITPAEVLEIVGEHHSISVEDIIRKYNKREVSDARHMFCKLMKTEFKYSLESIGGFLNGRDHTTILHSINTFNDRSKFEEGYMDDYEKILEKVNSKIN
jgi:chromosomal replication initiator protein